MTLIDTGSVGVPVSTAFESFRRAMETDLGFELTDVQTLAVLLTRAGYTPLTIAPSYDRQAEDLMVKGKKIDAIKLIRANTNMSLKDAKDYVERKWQPLCDAWRDANGWNRCGWN